MTTRGKMQRATRLPENFTALIPLDNGYEMSVRDGKIVSFIRSDNFERRYGQSFEDVQRSPGKIIDGGYLVKKGVGTAWRSIRTTHDLFLQSLQIFGAQRKKFLKVASNMVMEINFDYSPLDGPFEMFEAIVSVKYGKFREDDNVYGTPQEAFDMVCSIANEVALHIKKLTNQVIKLEKKKEEERQTRRAA